MKEPEPVATLLTRVRADIQGLRALAVIAVVAYHTGNLVAGGFLGVDMFFVISGFVIASSLFREVIEIGKIDVRRFFWRRFKRLAPALSVVVIFSVSLALFVLSPLGPSQSAAITGMAAIFSVANAAVFAHSSDYFSPQAELNPLLHTWSLSVEEQFYLVFPIAVALVTMVFAKRALNSITAVVTLGTIASFGLMLVGIVIPSNGLTGALLGFYSPVIRAWEFGVGAIVASLVLKLDLKNPILVRIGYFSGLALIVASLSGATLIGPTPGPATLVPVVGTGMAILFGRHRSLLTYPLTSEAAVKIGDRSYSIYLWHWPLISFASVVYEGSLLASACASGVSVVLALIAYRYVETPLRRGRFLSSWKKFRFVAGCVVPPVMLSLTVLGVSSEIEERVGKVSELPVGYTLGCHGPGPSTGQLEICIFESPSAAAESAVYLIGDSHAAHFSTGLVQATQNRGERLEIITASSCPLLGEAMVGEKPLASDESCRAWQQKTMRHLEESNPGVVILSGKWAFYVQNSSGSSSVENFKFSLGSALQRIESAGHRVILVQDIPRWTGTYSWSADRCTLFEVLAGCLSEMPLNWSLRQDELVRGTLEGLASERDQVVVADFVGQVCPNLVCSTTRDGLWVYRDSHHLTNAFSKTLAPRWESLLGISVPR